MISMAAAAKKYEMSYSHVHGWVSSGYINAEPMKPGTNSRDMGIPWREEEVLAAMALLHKAGVSTAASVLLARGNTPSIRALERALDKCKYIRSRGDSLAAGGE